MPLAKIEVRKNWPPEQVQAIIEAIYLAQREALQLPAHDRQIRYVEHKPEHFHVPPGKRALYQAVVENLGALGIAADDIFIVLNEIALENWGIRGGVPASEVDLGFKVNV